MILGLNSLGVGVLQKINRLPVPSTYNKINFYGGNNIFDEIQIFDRVIINEEIQKLNIKDYPSWDGNTLLLAHFDNKDLQAGNIYNLTSPIKKWQIYKKDTDDEILKKIDEIDIKQTEYMDYEVRSKKDYIYNLFPITENEIGQPLETEKVKVMFDGWHLIGLEKDKDVVFSFYLNLSSSELQNQTNMTTYKNNTKYHSYSWTEEDCFKGSLTCVGGILTDSQIIHDSEYITLLKNFINNKEEKILKNPNGDMWKVITNNFRYKYKDETYEQLFTVTFDFEECGDIK